MLRDAVPSLFPQWERASSLYICSLTDSRSVIVCNNFTLVSVSDKTTKVYNSFQFVISLYFNIHAQVFKQRSKHAKISARFRVTPLTLAFPTPFFMTISSFFSSVGCADDEALTRLFQTSFLFVFWSLYQSW